MHERAPLDTLMSYLAACGGCDRFDFHDSQGNPDPVAARDFAERIRHQAGPGVPPALTVEQVANRVTVCVTAEAAAV